MKELLLQNSRPQAISYKILLAVTEVMIFPPVAG